MCCKDNADCYAEGPLLEPLWPLRIIGGRECNNRQVDGEKGEDGSCEAGKKKRCCDIKAKCMCRLLAAVLLCLAEGGGSANHVQQLLLRDRKSVV